MGLQTQHDQNNSWLAANSHYILSMTKFLLSNSLTPYIAIMSMAAFAFYAPCLFVAAFVFIVALERSK